MNHLDARECGALLADVFHEMALVHGHVHGDPHAGNVYLRVHSCSRNTCTPELVLLGTQCTGLAGTKVQILTQQALLRALDHGLYHRIPDPMRRDLCKLLLASVSPFASRRRCSIYLLYWYKSTFVTGTKVHASRPLQASARLVQECMLYWYTSACFTGTKVHASRPLQASARQRAALCLASQVRGLKLLVYEAFSY
jgi:hypothetical protein